jgi:hypothetical protein
MGSVVMDQLDRLRIALADRYHLDREIGRGGMATVYLAHDQSHGRTVAIKVLRSDVGAALGSERFQREIQIEARLQHPHILPLYDSGTAEGLLYYVMPYVEGESLRERIRHEKQLSVDEAIRIAREVADALEYAHKHGVVHRDIKPGNILLSGGHAIVADFGIAKAISAAEPESLTASGIAIGTPEYMSPEQGSGATDVDHRTDIYAVGCVLYEMLAGAPPFTGRTAQTVLARHRHEPPPPLGVVRPNLAPEIGQAVERALAKIPADRFPTAAAFAASLGPGPTTTKKRPSTPWRRRAVWAALAVGLLGTLAVAAILRPNLAGHPSSSIGVVIVPFEGSADDSAATGASPGHVLLAEAVEWVPGLHALDGSQLPGSGGNPRAVPLSDLLRGAERLGGKYIVMGTVLPELKGSRLAMDLYSVSDGERIVRSSDTTAGARLDAAVGRLALHSIRALAEREHLDFGARKAMFSSTSSPRLLGS